MDKLQFIDEIKRLVRKADVERALDRLVEELEKAGSELAEDAIKAQSQFSKTQRDESRGSISFDNAKQSYSQINDQIFNILDALEREARGSASPTKSRNLKALWIGGSALLVLALVGFFVFGDKKENDVEQSTVDPNCPVFDSGSVFKVLVFPFSPVGPGAEQTNIHKIIVTKLSRFIDEDLKIKGSIYPADNKLASPDSPKDAERLTKNCKADLIIFGNTEPETSGYITILQYKFLNLGLANLKITENAVVIDTIPTISSIITGNTLLTKEIETTIALLFGIIAKETGHTAEAIAQLEKIETTDSTAMLLKGVVLADSYIAEGNMEKARSTYDKVLDTHPNYWLALNNRAALNYETGNYAGALEDYNAFVKITTEAKEKDTTRMTQALSERSAFYLKTKSLDKAEQDINAASKLKSKDDGRIQQLEGDILKEKKKQTKKKEEAERKLQANPNDTKALEEKAGADDALGNTQEALSAAKAAVENNSKDDRVYSILLEEAMRTNDTNTFKKLTRKTEQLRITKEELIQNAPELNQRFKTVIRQN